MSSGGSAPYGTRTAEPLTVVCCFCNGHLDERDEDCFTISASPFQRKTVAEHGWDECGRYLERCRTFFAHEACLPFARPRKGRAA